MQGQAVLQQAGGTGREGARLYYLDWLRVLATLGVFLFHASNVFNTAGFEIKNAEVSETIMFIQAFFFPWGMPLFFLVAGAGSWFALRRRTASQFTRERTLRLLVPFFTGTVLLGPLQLYLSWSHRTQTGVFAGSFAEFAGDRLSYPFPKILGGLGYHMWFLGFLFCFSLLALTLFVWLKGETGQRLVSRLADLCQRRGASLLFILPLAAVRVGLQPFFPRQQDWADFFYFGAFFVLGFLLFADERFLRAIRRDWPLLLAVGLVAFVAAAAVPIVTGEFDVEAAPRTLLDFAWWALFAACGWCGTALMLFVAMRYLDRDTQVLRYSLGAILPFFVVHQPVLLAIAYFVVQWDAGVLPKLVILVLSAFAISLGLYQFVIRRVALLRAMFGMKTPAKLPVVEPQESAPVGPPGRLPQP
jgi:glucans biosynthesis protein C